MTCYLDLLPAELLDQIASAGRDVYWPLATGYPRFARSLTPGRRVDYAIGFGYSVKIGDGSTTWTLNGVIHRTDGPAVYNDTVEIWKVNGADYRANGPAISCKKCGSEGWFNKHGLHRIGGPAIIYRLCEEYCGANNALDRSTSIPLGSSAKVWYKNGKLHRDDGPAFKSIYEDGDEIIEYWRNGEQATPDGIIIEDALEEIAEFARSKGFTAYKIHNNELAISYS